MKHTEKFMDDKRLQVGYSMLTVEGNLYASLTIEVLDIYDSLPEYSFMTLLTKDDLFNLGEYLHFSKESGEDTFSLLSSAYDETLTLNWEFVESYRASSQQRLLMNYVDRAYKHFDMDKPYTLIGVEKEPSEFLLEEGKETITMEVPEALYSIISMSGEADVLLSQITGVMRSSSWYIYTWIINTCKKLNIVPNTLLAIISENLGEDNNFITINKEDQSNRGRELKLGEN